MFESYVEFVYQSLLDLGNDNVVVARDVTLTGRTGIRHQIDVYYQFEKAGFSHRVAIECRNKSRAIDKDQVMAFKSKVQDIPGVQGIMVARKGYQSGAKTFAEDNGILAIDIAQLPRYWNADGSPCRGSGIARRQDCWRTILGLTCCRRTRSHRRDSRSGDRRARAHSAIFLKSAGFPFPI
jgi:hypothetical protein